MVGDGYQRAPLKILEVPARVNAAPKQRSQSVSTLAALRNGNQTLPQGKQQPLLNNINPAFRGELLEQQEFPARNKTSGLESIIIDAACQPITSKHDIVVAGMLLFFNKPGDFLP